MADTRTRIVEATTELLRVQGFNGTSLKQVIERSGATTGSVYHFFPGGKDELAVASIIESGAAYQELFELFADESPDDFGAMIAGFFAAAADALEEFDEGLSGDQLGIVDLVGEELGHLLDRLLVGFRVFEGNKH